MPKPGRSEEEFSLYGEPVVAAEPEVTQPILRNDTLDEWGLPRKPDGFNEMALPHRERPYYWGGQHRQESAAVPVASLIRKYSARPQETYVLRKWMAALEENQKLASCCRDPSSHYISAWSSTEEYREVGMQDWFAAIRQGFTGSLAELKAQASKPANIYVFHCQCGRDHRRFCVGGEESPHGREFNQPRLTWWL